MCDSLPVGYRALQQEERQSRARKVGKGSDLIFTGSLHSPTGLARLVPYHMRAYLGCAPSLTITW